MGLSRKSDAGRCHCWKRVVLVRLRWKTRCNHACNPETLSGTRNKINSWNFLWNQSWPKTASSFTSRLLFSFSFSSYQRSAATRDQIAPNRCSGCKRRHPPTYLPNRKRLWMQSLRDYGSWRKLSSSGARNMRLAPIRWNQPPTHPPKNPRPHPRAGPRAIRCNHPPT